MEISSLCPLGSVHSSSKKPGRLLACKASLQRPFGPLITRVTRVTHLAYVVGSGVIGEDLVMTWRRFAGQFPASLASCEQYHGIPHDKGWCRANGRISARKFALFELTKAVTIRIFSMTSATLTFIKVRYVVDSFFCPAGELWALLIALRISAFQSLEGPLTRSGCLTHHFSLKHSRLCLSRKHEYESSIEGNC